MIHPISMLAKCTAKTSEYCIASDLQLTLCFAHHRLQGSRGTLRFMENPPLDGVSIGSVRKFVQCLWTNENQVTSSFRRLRPGLFFLLRHGGMSTNRQCILNCVLFPHQQFLPLSLFLCPQVHYSSGVLNKAFVKSVRACQAHSCSATLEQCVLLLGKLFFYTNLSQLTAYSTFLDAAEKTCSVVDELFTEINPTTTCTTDEVREFVIEGWSTVNVAVDSSCTAEEDCSGFTLTPSPTPAPEPVLDYNDGCLK